jgi:hypothetical protein
MQPWHSIGEAPLRLMIQTEDSSNSSGPKPVISGA